MNTPSAGPGTASPRGPIAAATATSDNDDGDGLASDIRQFVTFTSGGEVFAVDMTPVQEIIRVPDVVRVPLAPATLDGLANLRGRVLPIVSLRRVLGFADKANDDTSRALVIDLGQPLGFVVDTVSSVVGVEPAKLEGVESVQATVNTDLLSAIIKDVGGHPMIMVLDFAKLIAQEFAQVAAIGARSAAVGSNAASGASEDEPVADELQLVSFEVAGQEYAIAIEDVQEIVQVPDSVVHVPHSESHVLGIMTLRNRLLPLVSLRRMFGLPPRADDELSRIVVVSIGGASVGIVMDRVNEVLRVPNAQVDGMPGLFSRDGNLADISDICRMDGGKRLVSIIDARNLFRHTSIREALSKVDKLPGDGKALDVEGSEALHDDDEQFVVFRLGDEEFGVPIDSVQEIVRVPDQLTHVPKAPPFVEGVINLRGAVLPVVDLRRRLGLGTVERSDRQRVMVFLVDGARAGFVVDSVAEVLRIPTAAVEATPRLSSGQGRLLARMANLQKQKRLVQLLAPEHLMEASERVELAALAD